MSEARTFSPRVTTIPATLNRFTAMPIASTRKRRVAAYARVSTNSEEQKTSYEAQVDYYTAYIRNHDDWAFVQVYADKGITGTSTKKRERFNDMVEDALAGKIDLIITKSVSRFARNTVDSLTTIRKLKKYGVEVYFEEQNIYTLDSKGELLLTIMSSLAQEESRSISENVTWGQRKRFADGKVSMPYKHFLGYKRGEDGQPEIEPEQAEIVRRIYRLFLEGKTPSGICKMLMNDGIPTPGGKTHWQTTTILSILTNEKYKGDALLQKTFCTDFLTKEMKVNEGEVPQYYVEDSHPAIISREMFNQVQQEIEKRKTAGRPHRGTSIFAGKIVCECCGDFFGSKVWHSTDKYRKVIWRCNQKYKGDEKCVTPLITEDELKKKFLQAYNQLLGDKQALREDCRFMITMLSDTAELATEKADCVADFEVVRKLMEQAIQENATVSLDQDEYNERYDALVRRFEKDKLRLKQIETKVNKRKAKRDELERFMEQLEKNEIAFTFTDILWISMIDHVTVCKDGSCRFTFRNSIEITI